MKTESVNNWLNSKKNHFTYVYFAASLSKTMTIKNINACCWKRSIAILILLISGFIKPSNAQAPFLAATASKASVGLGEQFQITFSFNAAGRSFQGPDLKDFTVLSGPNQSSSMQFVNGNFSQSISFSYYLQPKATGNFKIGPATIEFEGNRIASNVIQLIVTKGNPQAQSGGGDKQGKEQSNISSKNLFVRAVVNKSNVLKGEGLIVSFKLYSNLNVLDFAIPKMPSLNGFYNQDIELPKTLDRSIEVLDGNRYTVWEIKKMVLFPQQSGTLLIDPMELECLVRVKVASQRSADPFSIFNDPFFGMGGVQDIKHSFKSEPVKIVVNELPANAPTYFKGAVGELNFDARLDKNVTKANEAVNLKIKISGNGNLKLADIQDLELPTDLESYDPKITENFKATSSGVNGTKVIEYLIIPRIEGEYEIPKISFTYYSISKRQYLSKTAGPFLLKVEKGNGTQATISTGRTEKSDFQLLGTDIRYIKNSVPDFNTGSSLSFGSPLFYTLSFSPFLLFGAITFFVRRRDKQMSNLTLLKMKKATGVATKRLALARKQLGTDKEELAFEEILKALWGYIGDKFTVPQSELSKEKVTEILSSKNVSEEIIQLFHKSIDACEMARYAGTAMGIKAQTVYENSEKVINGIEEKVKA